MDPKRPWECADMSEVRTEIDRIDATLVDLIAERFGYVDRAWQLKMTTREGAVVQWRIQQVIDRVKERAAEKNLPPEMIEMVGAQWRNMIGWFVQFEEEKLRHGQDASGKAGGESWVLNFNRTCRCSKSCSMASSTRPRSSSRF